MLIFGILLVAGIYLGDRYKRRRAGGRERRENHGETSDLSMSPHGSEDSNDYDEALADLNHLMHENRDETAPVAGDHGDSADSGEAAGSASAGETTQADERLIVFYLKAPEGHAFAGPGLFEALYTAGLSLGTMGIYHDTNSHDETIFSVANIFEPGTLETNDPDNFSTRGLALFMQLPGPADEQDAFERMLGKAEILAERLGGELQDEQHQPLDDAGVARARSVLR